MSTPLRITFEGKDYTYALLTRGITRYTAEIKISMDGREFSFVRGSQNELTVAEVTADGERELLKAIARTIALRYRL
jgi:hypothetical protein